MKGENQAKYRFDRMEVAGSLGDLGTLLPLAIGMILLNKLHATNVFVLIGLFYIVAGHYFGVPVPVQPMKVIGAYAIATGLTPTQIVSSSLWMGVFLLFLGITGLIQLIGKYTPKSTVRGVQLGVGVVLMIRGLKLIIEPDPNLAIQYIGPVSMSLILGTAGLVLTFLLLENKKLPAALVLIATGIILGIFIGKPINAAAFNWSLHLPKPLPYGWPSVDDIIWVIPVLVLPQIPMTIGNAIISNTDITQEYFSDRAKRVTYRSVSTSQGLADIVSFFFGGIPMCHGAGGLAAHYRFGARTAGSNLIIGGIFVLLALIFGENIVAILKLLPFSLLGVLLVFAGLQLALMIQDLRDRKDLFVALLMLGIALATNLGVAFIAGIIAAYVFKSDKFKV
ncbi:MAG: putative sulfate/molybdate transporter [Deltaproteobacteria bacterium]|nr:putative sulfate/molybdate transporter [Deltaproteobacteria bacterium]